MERFLVLLMILTALALTANGMNANIDFEETHEISKGFEVTDLDERDETVETSKIPEMETIGTEKMPFLRQKHEEWKEWAEVKREQAKVKREQWAQKRAQKKLIRVQKRIAMIGQIYYKIEGTRIGNLAHKGKQWLEELEGDLATDLEIQELLKSISEKSISEDSC